MTPALQAISYDIKHLSENRGVFTFRDGAFIKIKRPPTHPGTPIPSSVRNAPPLPEDLPESWDVRDSLYADLTGDGVPELVLLIWRPRSDSLTVDSCHIALIDPNPDGNDRNASRSYREIWVSSALPIPLVQIEAGDINDDGLNELVALEGSYETGRDGPGDRVSVWVWNGSGLFTDWRSEPSRFDEIALEDINTDGIADIVAW